MLELVSVGLQGGCVLVFLGHGVQYVGQIVHTASVAKGSLSPLWPAWYHFSEPLLLLPVLVGALALLHGVLTARERGTRAPLEISRAADSGMAFGCVLVAALICACWLTDARHCLTPRYTGRYLLPVSLAFAAALVLSAPLVVLSSGSKRRSAGLLALAVPAVCVAAITAIATWQTREDFGALTTMYPRPLWVGLIAACILVVRLVLPRCLARSGLSERPARAAASAMMWTLAAAVALAHSDPFHYPIINIGYRTDPSVPWVRYGLLTLAAALGAARVALFVVRRHRAGTPTRTSAG